MLVRLLQNGAPAQLWGGPVLLCVLVTPSSSEPVPASSLAPLLWSWHPVGTGWPYQAEWATGKTHLGASNPSAKRDMLTACCILLTMQTLQKPCQDASLPITGGEIRTGREDGDMTDPRTELCLPPHCSLA